ncbi:SHOCT domain-containing protein [Chloroflexota bacterium]
MMWHFGDGMGWWMVFGWIWMFLFWGGVITLVMWGIKKITDRDGSQLSLIRIEPLDFAKERYARGEISHDELDQIKRDLS